MTEQSRIITEEEWQEYLSLKEQVDTLKDLLLRLHPEYKGWIDKNFGETANKSINGLTEQEALEMQAYLRYLRRNRKE